MSYVIIHFQFSQKEVDRNLATRLDLARRYCLLRYKLAFIFIKRLSRIILVLVY